MSVALVLAARDNVATAVREITPGRYIIGGKEVLVLEGIPAGYKVCIDGIMKGGIVVKYGHGIGRATEDISAGSLVHIHNMESML